MYARGRIDSKIEKPKYISAWAAEVHRLEKVQLV